MHQKHDLVREALEQGDGKKLRQLLKTDVSLIEWLSHDLSSTLHSATEQNHVDMVDVLLDYGADINARGFNDWTPLHTAAYNAAPEVAELLIDRGADPNLRDRDAHTPLFLATNYNGIPGYAVLGVLLKGGAKLDLLTAIALAQEHVVAALLAQHPHLLQTDPNAEDFLSWAVMGGNLDLIRLLLERGAKVNACQHFDLPLTNALSLSKDKATQIIKELIKYGADPKLKPAPDKLSPLEWAQAHAPDLVSLLTSE